MQLHIYKTVEEVIDELAKWITNHISQTLKKQDRFSIALSGGETPKILYKMLAAAPYHDLIEWKKIHFFWGDERVVPFTDDSNNAKMAFDNLLNKINVPEENIHIMRTDISPDLAADEYEKLLHQYFDNDVTSFDLVLLGMGKDGHTLSLFPASTILQEEKHWVNAVYVEDQKMYRITLMPSIVNRASAIIFLITGIEKSTTLRSVLEDTFQPEHFPSQLIKPLSGELHWFLDDSAASKLKQKS
jgi:6-phosphogluconolactonase